MPAPPRHPASSLPDADWTEVRRRYETTDDPVASICSDAGITTADLDKIRKREKWRRQMPRSFPAGRRTSPTAVVAETPPPATSSNVSASETPTPTKPRAKIASPQTPAARKRLLDRLAAAISLKLEQLERRMTEDLERSAATEGATATDHERETRAIGALIDNLGKVTEMETGLTRTRDKPTNAAATDLAGEADRYRRELAQRLQKIIDSSGAKS